MIPLLWLFAAYFLGGIPFGYLLVRWTSGQDVRSLGSGNIGATNVLRTAGRGIGLLTLALDMLKGWLAVFLMSRYGSSSSFWLSAAAVAVLVGHAYPALLRFKGGKAVASFVGAFAFLTPLPLLATTVLFVIVVGWSKLISLGSIVGAICFPFAVWLLLHPDWPVLTAALLAGLLILYRHRGNMQRLSAGTEHVFRFRSKR